MQTAMQKGATLPARPTVGAPAMAARLEGVAHRLAGLVQLDAWIASIALDTLLQGRAERAARALRAFGSVGHGGDD